MPNVTPIIVAAVFRMSRSGAPAAIASRACRISVGSQLNMAVESTTQSSPYAMRQRYGLTQGRTRVSEVTVSIRRLRPA